MTILYGKVKEIKKLFYLDERFETVHINLLKEEARLDRTFIPVEVDFFFSTKDIKPNGLDVIILNLMKVPLFCTEDRHSTCNLG